MMRRLLRPCLLSLSALASAAIADDTKVSIVLIGDSYLTGSGLDDSAKFKTRLLSELGAKGLAVDLIDGEYNETSASTDARLKVFFALPRFFPSAHNPVVILELGSNDCYSMTLAQTRASLANILATFADKSIPVLLAGTTAYQGCGGAANPTYATQYAQMFVDLADQYGALYYRDFKDGVSGHPALLQDDGDHPNAKGEAIIVAAMLPVVVQLVARAKKP